jgi:glycosyltransferase involved in cell wall biosynthesis
MTDVPRVSVCIPVYNGARYLPQAIESVLDQEFTDFELVICDDASTDETPELCERYRDDRIRYVRFDTRVGQAGNFNRCFDASRGPLVTLLHADDFYLPTLLARRVTQLEDHPEAGFACGALRMVDASGATVSMGRQWSTGRLFHRGELVEPLLHGCVILALGLVLRRECSVKFRTDLTWGHDWDWVIRLAETNRAYYDPDAAACYRVHDASGTAEILNAAKNGDQERRILEEALARLPASDRRTAALRRSSLRSLAHRHMYFAEQALLAGRNRVARYNIRYAVLANRSMAVRPTTWAIVVGSLAGVRWYRSYQRLRGLRLGDLVRKRRVAEHLASRAIDD